MQLNSAPLSIGSEEDAHDVEGYGTGPWGCGQRAPLFSRGPAAWVQGGGCSQSSLWCKRDQEKVV